MDLNKFKAAALACEGWKWTDRAKDKHGTHQFGMRKEGEFYEIGTIDVSNYTDEYADDIRILKFIRAAQPTAILELIAMVEHQAAELEISQRECGQAVTANAQLRDALAGRPKPVEQADPLDSPLPCDVTVGCGTHRRGTTLRALVVRMRILHGMAMAAAPTVDPGAWLAATQAVMPDGSQRDLGSVAQADAGSAP